MQIKKVRITVEVKEGAENLPLVVKNETRYQSSRVVGSTKIKYYTHGVKILPLDSFKASFPDTRPMGSPYILLLSINSQIPAPPGTYLIRTRNKTALVLGVRIVNVTDGIHTYGDPGTQLDVSKFEFSSAIVDGYTNYIDIDFKSTDVKEFIETEEDVIHKLTNLVEPSVSAMENHVYRFGVDPFSSEEATEKVVELALRVIGRMGFFNATGEKARQMLRDKLGDEHVLDSVVAYTINGVTWANKAEYESDLIEYGSLERAMNARRNLNRVEYLLDKCNFEKRISHLSLEEINCHDISRPNISFAMTDDEARQWSETENEGEKAILERTAMQRWKTIKEMYTKELEKMGQI